MLHVIHQDPHQHAERRSRWTLAAIGRACPWLGVRLPSSVWYLLDRLDIHYKRARAHVHSPDPNYLPKLQSVRVHLQQAALGGGDVVLFEDEFTFYRQPSLAQAWERAGHEQTLAELGHRPNRHSRLVAALNAVSGQVHCRQADAITLQELVRFYQGLREAYPEAETIWLVQDNWPWHFHPDVLAALQEQVYPWPLARMPSWPKEPRPNAPRLQLPIRLVLLPTYASWTNPIEKLWRLLRQELLHVHHFEDQWEQLKQAVNQFMDQIQYRAEELRRYVGLTDPTRLYQTAFQKAGITL